MNNFDDLDLMVAIAKKYGGAVSIDWSAILNKPSTFPPSTHNHNTLYATKSSEHTHTNKAELDKIVIGDKTKWDGYQTLIADLETRLAALENSTP